MAKNTKEVDVQWFAYCGNNKIPNDSLAAALAEIGIGENEGVKHPDMMCSDGIERDVWDIPSNFVNKLRAAKQSDARFTFRFFKRNGSEGDIYPADFVEKPRRSKAFQEAERKHRITQGIAAGKK